MDYTVYIPKSQQNGVYYIGSTGNLEEHIQRHNQGRSRYTKSGIPWKVVCTEQFENRFEAIKRERQIKRRKSRDYIEGLVRTSR